jgi:Ca-activated chloride channel homolog
MKLPVIEMKKSLGLGIGVVGVVLSVFIRSSVSAEQLDLERSVTGFNLRLSDIVGNGPVVLEPRFQVERSFDLQTWEPVGELLRTGAGSHVLEVNSSPSSIGFFRVLSLPVNLVGADLAGMDLTSASLVGADLSGADLRYADLSGADLTGANLMSADLRGADLRTANLSGASFKDALLSGANLIGAKNAEGIEIPDTALFLGGSNEIDLGSGIPEIGDIGVPGGIVAPGLPPSPALDAAFAGGGAAISAPRAPSANLGFAVGRANDVGNFRQNIENEFLPLFTDITYEGLFYDYFFDTGLTEACESLFCPSYAQALSPDPFSEREERYLSVGLNSGIKESDFKRKQLNLTVVIDVSGSMDGAFNRFFYDGTGVQRELSNEESALLKMDVAIEAVTALLDHLEPQDRIGIVSFNSESRVVQPLSKVSNLNLDDVRQKVTRLRAFSGTNMSAGMRAATNQYQDLLEIDPSESENRIIFVTDAMPNQGETSRTGLVGMIESNAQKNLYSTVIGVGVDFNTDLVESITKNRGANYHSVHSPAQFIEQMDENFDFMVTPLVFDLRLALEGEGWSIDQVFGSPEADEATGEVFRVNTLFPSRSEGGQTRGGLILVKLSRNPEVENRELKISASFENRLGEKSSIETLVEFVDTSDQHFDNTGIRKGILLTRYASLIRNWVLDERSSYQDERPILRPLIDSEWGIPILPPWPISRLGQWERRSTPLYVAHKYREIFSQFRTYFVSESEALGDEDLQQELKILDRLANNPDLIVAE